jgi:predicted GNAT superfamily acetyltransferase
MVEISDTMRAAQVEGGRFVLWDRLYLAEHFRGAGLCRSGFSGLFERHADRTLCGEVVHLGDTAGL